MQGPLKTICLTWVPCILLLLLLLLLSLSSLILLLFSLQCSEKGWMLKRQLEEHSLSYFRLRFARMKSMQ